MIGGIQVKNILALQSFRVTRLSNVTYKISVADGWCSSPSASRTTESTGGIR